MQGGISVNPLARVSANFNALYLMILFIPAALNMLGHAIFSTPRGVEWALAANLVYAIALSALGLILISAEKSVAMLAGKDWRVSFMLRVVSLDPAHRQEQNQHISPPSLICLPMYTEEGSSEG